MAVHLLNTFERDKTGKEAAKKIRMKGFIPAVLYGSKGNKNLSVKTSEFEVLFEEIGEHSIITLEIDGKGKAEVIVKDFQLDPVKKDIIHVDFFEIQMDKLLKTEIPIRVIGVANGVKKGGILETYIRDIEIECFPKDMPDFISVNIENLEIGNSFHVRDIKVDKKLRIVSNPDQVVLTVGAPTKIVTPVEEAPAAEVEKPAEEEKVTEQGK